MSSFDVPEILRHRDQLNSIVDSLSRIPHVLTYCPLDGTGEGEHLLPSTIVSTLRSETMSSVSIITSNVRSLATQMDQLANVLSQEDESLGF